MAILNGLRKKAISMSKKPTIGIVSKHLSKNGKRPNMYIRDEIKQAIFDNNGIAIGILLPKDELEDVSDKWSDNLSNEEFDALKAQINLCDGIVFQGGGACDNYEMIVAKYCYECDIPTLGICCGQNVLVRSLRGTTIKIDNHYLPDFDYAHEIRIDKDSIFYKIVGVDKMKVNSRHTKTVKESPFLERVAFSPEDYAEVLEAKDKKFFMSVQFHPESLYKTDENMNKIFKYFLEVCKCKEKNEKR